MTFQVTLVPCSMSPVIRDMLRHTLTIQAKDLHAARCAFPYDLDTTGEWMVEKIEAQP